MSVDAILKEVEGLSAGERAELIGQLIDRYGETAPAVEISDELRAELDRRSAEHEANPTEGYTWEQVVEYVKRKK
jgi:putative addiction module component (TIGR02574 family)